MLKKLKCGGRIISEYDENLPKDLTVEDILTYSSNIGSVKIGEIIGKDKMIKFLNKIGVLEKMKFDIEEIGTPIPFRWRVVNSKPCLTVMVLPPRQFNLLKVTQY